MLEGRGMKVTRSSLTVAVGLITLVSVGIVAPHAAGAGPRPTATGSPVVIGNVGTYGGLVGSMLAPGQTAIQSFAKWVNAGTGLNGHVLQIVSGDDQGDPAKNLSLVQSMVTTQHAIAFVGNMTPATADGSVGYLQQNSIPVVGGDLMNALWDTSPILFPQGAGPADQISALRKLAVTAGKTPIGVLFCGELKSCGYLNQLLGGGTQVSLAQPDFISECAQAQNRGAQALIVALDPNSLLRLAHSCGQLNYKPLLIPWSLAMTDSNANNADLQVAAGSVGTFPWPATDTQAAQVFHAAMNQYAPGAVLSSMSSAGWTAGLLLNTASANLPAVNPQSADILKGLWSIKNNILGGAAPPLTFVQGQAAQPSHCTFSMQMTLGKWTAPSGGRLPCATVAVSAVHNPTAPYNPVTYTATVSPPPDGGTVAFADGSTPIPGCTAVPVNVTTGQSACKVKYTTVATHTITATYSGDANYLPSAPSPSFTETMVPLPTSTITSGTTLTAGQTISGTAADAGGPGVIGVILYYKRSTGQVGSLATQCTGCGVGSTNVTWSYTLPTGGPLSPGPYFIVAQSVDTAYNFGGPSNFQSITVH
jgi:branched-chain amino acid transport system substrate-binding protein